jgi:hypothetical protein
MVAPIEAMHFGVLPTVPTVPTMPMDHGAVGIGNSTGKLPIYDVGIGKRMQLVPPHMRMLCFWYGHQETCLKTLRCR